MRREGSIAVVSLWWPSLVTERSQPARVATAWSSGFDLCVAAWCRSLSLLHAFSTWLGTAEEGERSCLGPGRVYFSSYQANETLHCDRMSLALVPFLYTRPMKDAQK